MGTLGGHILPGSFFICFSIWWSFITAIRFVQSKPRRSSDGSSAHRMLYRTSATMPCICLPGHKLRQAPMESWVKIILASIGIFGEIVTGMHFNYIRPINKDDASLYGCDSEGETMQSNHSHGHHHGHVSNTPLPFFFEYVNAQHITMYSTFLIGSFVEIAMHRRRNAVPYNLDMACGLIAFGVEAFLFAFHLHSRAPLDIRIHVLLVYAIYGCVIFCALEMIWPHQALLTYGRILCTCLQGTWFWQAGFILYPPVNSPAFIWDRCNHEQIMTVTMMFCWHLILILIGLLIQLWFISFIYRKSKHLRSQWSELAEIDALNQRYQDDWSNKESVLYLKCPNLDDDEQLRLSDESEVREGFNFMDESKKMTLDELI